MTYFNFLCGKPWKNKTIGQTYSNRTGRICICFQQI